MRVSIAIVLVVLAASPAMAQQNQRRGAVGGGLAGAAIGAIIGDNNDEAGAGAAIGGAVGAITGSLLGKSADEEQQQRQYYNQQQLAYQQQQQAVAVQQAVSTADVVALCRSGLPESVVINQIRQRGVQRKIEVADIIQLHQQGVSEPIISAMQYAQVGPPAPTYAAPAPRPIIVERRYEVAPVYVMPPPPRTGIYLHYGHGRHRHHW